jgi:MoxR-like ATPase
MPSPLYTPKKNTHGRTINSWLGKPPPWRKLAEPKHKRDRQENLKEDDRSFTRGVSYLSTGDDEAKRVNMALLLRRPLLVTGEPGLGKSTLAYHIAVKLGLGELLRWEINSQTSLQDGLYHYDAVDHLRAIQQKSPKAKSLGEFITLGPLGTALYPSDRPRALLVDELDKSSFDLPNDLLHVFEEGSFRIPELVRAASSDGEASEVIPYDPRIDNERLKVERGQISTWHHPVVVITSNGEREFPEAFKRRCVQLELKAPNTEHLIAIARSHLGELSDEVLQILREGEGSRESTDVFLQTLFLHKEFDQPFVDVFNQLKRKG